MAPVEASVERALAGASVVAPAASTCYLSIAAKLGVPVVPVYVAGLESAYSTLFSVT